MACGDEAGMIEDTSKVGSWGKALRSNWGRLLWLLAARSHDGIGRHGLWRRGRHD